jgi:DNA-binding protein H-NS
MTSYAELMSQIEQLKREADKARKAESAKILKELRETIQLYGFNEVDLGFSSTPKPNLKEPGKDRKNKVLKTKRKLLPKYEDSHGNTWTGRGKTPRWLAEALANGANIDQFRVS